ncbi:hypothetical protein NE237_029643 [Protea cynaroides]|uniref:Cullin N-terminal domain-containing protein n=1 Tax=Protea cynaroides TaxID=273540 RepID=A0A9Q0GTJ4_9MAGN|nr:hypothetical protein NE237_029643 [Protea cynaroides]
MIMLKFFVALQLLLLSSTALESNQSVNLQMGFRSFEDEWPVVQEGIDKLFNQLEGIPNQKFTSGDYMRYYTAVYNACVVLNWQCQQFYDQYKETFKEHITSKVLPSLREKKDMDLLQEFVKRWSDYKVIIRWLSRFFHYLNRYFIPAHKLPSLEEIALMSFTDMVYAEISDQLREAVVSMIDQERDGHQIDQVLLKKVLDIFVEMGGGSMKYYTEDLEVALLKATAAYYSQKASNWIKDDSYLFKVEECLKQEKERASSYLHSSSEKKLIEVVEHELLFVEAIELQEIKGALRKSSFLQSLGCRLCKETQCFAEKRQVVEARSLNECFRVRDAGEHIEDGGSVGTIGVKSVSDGGEWGAVGGEDDSVEGEECDSGVGC